MSRQQDLMSRAWRVLFILGLIFVSIAIYFFNHSVGNREDVENIYFADNISPAHRQLIDRFNKEYEGRLRVIPVNLPFSKFSTNERKELLARSLRSKSDRIDIFGVDLIWAPRFARWASKLDMYISTNQRKSIIPQAMKSCIIDSHVVAIPFYIDVAIMYYRKDLVEKLPDSEKWQEKLKASINWDDFINLAEKVRDRDGFSYLFAADNYEGLVCSFIELLHRSSDSLFYADKINLNTPETRQALQMLVDFVHRYKFTPQQVTGYDEYKTYLYALEHDTPFFRGWPGVRKQYNKTIPFSDKLKLLETAALPHFRGAKPASVLGGWNLMIPESSRKKQQALEFIRFILRPENQKIMYEASGYIPVVKSVYDDPDFIALHSELTYLKRILKQGFHRPFLSNYTKISDTISYFAHLAIKGEIGVEQALIKASETINSRQTLIK